MVKTTNLRYCNDGSEFNCVHGPQTRRVLAQREVRSGFVIVRSEQPQMTVQGSLVEDNDMIETLAPKSSNQPFDISSLPGRAGSRKNFLDSHGLHLLDEIAPEDAVAIAQQIARCCVPRERFPQLLHSPLCCRMSRNAEMYDAPAFVSQDQEDIKDLEPESRHGEKKSTETMLLT
jgi:hypothetical protein